MASISLFNNQIVVSGNLNFETVVNLWNECLPLLQKIPDLHFDLSKVTAANSAALAFLLELQKTAAACKKNIFFHNVPATLLSIAAVAGVDKILKL